MKDICNTIPPQDRAQRIEYYHFVYEANLHTLAQPFLRPHLHAYLAFKGTATFKADGVSHRITPGTLFFTFPFQSHEFVEDKDFTYLYITFGGEDALRLLRRFNIRPENAVFENFGHLIDFWMSAIRRISPENAVTLTESVLLYTLSFIHDNGAGQNRLNAPRFDSILEYIGRNFADPELSIGKIADMFFYNEKYLSSLFIKNTGVKFTDYLTKMRIDHAVDLITNDRLSVAALAAKCGFSDPMYFSKVFKKHTGYTPSKYPKNT